MTFVKNYHTVLVVRLFIVFISLIGFGKDVFAVSTDDHPISNDYTCFSYEFFELPGDDWTGNTCNGNYSFAITENGWSTTYYGNQCGYMSWKRWGVYVYFYNKISKTWTKPAGYAVYPMWHPAATFAEDKALFLPFNTRNNPNFDEQTCKIDPCKSIKLAKIAECGGEQYVDWSAWDNLTCVGGKCLFDQKKNLGSTCE